TIRHDHPGDVELDLITPGLQRLRLKAAAQQQGKDLVTFFPELTMPVDDLTSVSNARAYDKWKLVARDVVGGATGTLESWSLRLKTDLNVTTSPVTNYPGRFFFDQLPAGVYTITPGASNRWFWPRSVTITNVSESNVVEFIETAGPPPAIITP